MIRLYFIINDENKIVAHFNNLKDAVRFAKENGWPVKNIRKFGR